MSAAMDGGQSTPGNGADSSKDTTGGSSNNNHANSSKQQTKSGAVPKSLDGTRKQTASPVNGSSSSKKPAPKAWTTGTNPITQRSTASPPTNGVAVNGSAKAPQAHAVIGGTSESNTVNQHAHDRLLFLLANFTGLDATITLKNGEQFSGIFSGATLDTDNRCYILKMVRRMRLATTSQTNGTPESVDELVGEGDQHVVSFNVADTVDLDVRNVDLESSSTRPSNGPATGFKTDAEISSNFTVRERELQRWQPGPDEIRPVPVVAKGSGGIAEWDQFEANERLYNVRSTYHEDLYTTTIDRSDPKYRERELKAARLADEVEKDGTARRRAAAAAEIGLDEEDKYSGVRRETPTLGKRGPQAYVPPSQRSAAPRSTTPAGATPVDPAIISAQLARPDTVAQPTHPLITLESGKTLDANASPSSSKTKPAEEQDLKVVVPQAEGSSAAQASAVSATQDQPKPTDNYYQNVYESFKQFTSSEKLRLQQHQRALQAQRSNTARQEKSVKLNDLKKFSQNFKLHSRVPEDLVPILAKSKEKQDEIRDKAEQQAAEKEQKAKDKPAASPTSQSASQRDTPVASVDSPADTSSPLSQRSRLSQAGKQTNGATQPPRGPTSFSQRVAQNQAQYRSGMPANGPQTLAVHTVQPASRGPVSAPHAGLTSPTSSMAGGFNVKALEFRPNPTASTFTPGGASDKANAKRPSVSKSSPSASVASGSFFSANKKPSKMAQMSEDSLLASDFNPIKRMLEDPDEQRKAQFAANGGIPQAYRTPPVWHTSDVNQQKSYNDLFPKAPSNPQIPPMPGQGNGVMAHQHQLPLHLQNAPPSQQTPRFYSTQPHHAGQPHGDDQRMHYSSSNSSVQPSPRMNHPSMAYAGQMHPQMPNFAYGMPAGAMSPAMHMRPMPPGPFMGPQDHNVAGGHMMMQQPSNGPYMNGRGPQQMPMFSSPVPSHAQPHFGGHGGQHQMQGGFAGSPRGHPMSHQGSQQGHGQQAMYMIPGQGGPMMMPQHGGQMTPIRGYAQPQYGGQGPPQAYGMQHRAMSNHGYNHQMTPRQQHNIPQQGPGPGAMVPSRSSAGDDGR